MKYYLRKFITTIAPLLITGCLMTSDVFVTDKNRIETPDYGKIVFVYRDELSNSNGIYIISANGSDLKPVVIEMQNTIDPSWSPDGGWVVFSALINNINQIYTVKTDGSGLKQLTSGSHSSYAPAWSKDGKYILFLSQSEDFLSEEGRPLQQGYIMNSDGLEQRRFTDEHKFITTASWYKDNNLISIAMAETRYTLRILIVDIRGQVQNQFPEVVLNGKPNWSSNGEMIVFAPYVTRVDCIGIVLFQINDFEQKCFIHNTLAPPVVNKSPSWSPKNDYIVFSSNKDGDFDLYVMKSDGSGIVQITNMEGDEVSPAWGP